MEIEQRIYFKIGNTEHGMTREEAVKIRDQLNDVLGGLSANYLYKSFCNCPKYPVHPFVTSGDSSGSTYIGGLTGSVSSGEVCKPKKEKRKNVITQTEMILNLKDDVFKLQQEVYILRERIHHPAYTAKKLKELLLEEIRQESKAAFLNLIEVKDQNCNMAGAYQGMIEAGKRK